MYYIFFRMTVQRNIQLENIQIQIVYCFILKSRTTPVVRLDQLDDILFPGSNDHDACSSQDHKDHDGQQSSFIAGLGVVNAANSALAVRVAVITQFA